MPPLFRLPVRRSARELDEELAFHLDMRARELMAHGWSPEAARAEARRQFGDLEDARRFCRQVDSHREKRLMRTEYFAELRQDIGFAFRSLRRAPAFSLVAALTLALGVGANTAIFSVVRGILLRPLPFAEPDRLVLVASTYQGRRFPYTSPANAVDWQTRNRSFTSLAVTAGHSAVLTGAGEPEEIDGVDVSADFFGVLGVRPVVGRLQFTTEEASWQGPKSVIVGETIWRTRFGGDPSLVGRLITLDNERYEVVRVAPAASTYPDQAMLWFPFSYDPAGLASSRGAVYLGVIGRLKPGVTVAAANADMEAISRQLEAEYPDANAKMGTVVVPLHQWITGSLDRPLLILLGGVAFVLLIACANVANLLLVRGVVREGEIAVRTVLGAGRSRLVRQLVTESMVLSLIGAGGGLLLAMAGTRVLLRAAPATIPRLGSIEIDGMVLAFTVIVAVVTGLLFGLVPARLVVRSDLARTIREGGRGGSQRAGGHRARRALVIAEVALSVMLLAGAGLLIRSFQRLMSVDPGFRTEGAVSFALSLPESKYPPGQRQADFMRTLLDRLKSVPGVDAAGAGLGLPLTSFRFSFSFMVTGRPPANPSQLPSAEVRVATADYFRTMGIPVIRGRGFAPTDREGGQRVLLITETAARQFFPDEDPIGKHVKFGWGRDGGSLEGDVIGVVGDIKQTSLAAATLPQFWASFDQWPVSSVKVVIHGTRSPDAVIADARRIIREIDPDLALAQVKTLDAVLADSVAQPRFYMLLLSAFAVVAIVLSAIGIYGVIAYLVGQRSREIGIRMALGASQDRVVAMIVREGSTMAIAGLLIGTAGALLLTQLLQALLFGVTATDPITYLLVAAVLAAVALSASWLPARRAARVDPVVTMRSD